MVHMTESGVNAGRRLCGVSRDDGQRNVHAVLTPLHNPAVREQICPSCIKAWAMEAYEEGDFMPDYIVAIRKEAAATVGG